MSSNVSASRTRLPRLVVKHAGSLGIAFSLITEEFKLRHPGVEVVAGGGGSAALVREVTGGAECSILASADNGLISRLMFPEHAGWSVVFASSEMVLRYTDRSAYHEVVTEKNWHEVLQRDGVTFWHSSPDEDPGGYRALMVLQLAEKHYGVPGMYGRLMTAEHDRIASRATAQDSALGYSFGYGTVMGVPGSRFIRFPEEVNLSNKDLDWYYSQASVSIPGREAGKRIDLKGQAIRFGATIPSTCPDIDVAIEWLRLLLGATGATALLRSGLVPVKPVVARGDRLPEKLRDLCTVS